MLITPSLFKYRGRVNCSPAANSASVSSYTINRSFLERKLFSYLPARGKELLHFDYSTINSKGTALLFNTSLPPHKKTDFLFLEKKRILANKLPRSPEHRCKILSAFLSRLLKSNCCTEDKVLWLNRAFEAFATKYKNEVDHMLYNTALQSYLKLGAFEGFETLRKRFSYSLNVPTYNCLLQYYAKVGDGRSFQKTLQYVVTEKIFAASTAKTLLLILVGSKSFFSRELLFFVFQVLELLKIKPTAPLLHILLKDPPLESHQIQEYLLLIRDIFGRYSIVFDSWTFLHILNIYIKHDQETIVWEIISTLETRMKEKSIKAYQKSLRTFFTNAVYYFSFKMDKEAVLKLLSIMEICFCPPLASTFYIILSKMRHTCSV
jgi:hypothetical protein